MCLGLHSQALASPIHFSVSYVPPFLGPSLNSFKEFLLPLSC